MASAQTLSRESRTSARRFSSGTGIRLTQRRALQYLRRLESVDLSNGAVAELRRAAAAVRRGGSHTFSREMVGQIADSLHWAPAGHDGDADGEAQASVAAAAGLTVGAAVGIALAALVVGIAIGYAAGDVGEDKGSTVTVTNEGNGTVTVNGGDGDTDD